jgi:hypothetical protein
VAFLLPARIQLENDMGRGVARAELCIATALLLTQYEMRL